MPAGKRRQSNAMLYTLITFVALFVIATTAAVIYYVKAEDFRTRAKESGDELSRHASQEEVRNIGAIVGTRLPRQTSLGTVVEHLDQMILLVKGAPVRATSAEVKVAEARQAIQPLLERARAFITLPAAAPTVVDPNAAPNADPNAAAPPQIALAGVINDLLTKLEKTTQEKIATEQELVKTRGRFDDAVAAMKQTEKDLMDRVAAYEQLVTETKANYDKLKASADQVADERIGALRGDLDKTRADAKQLNDDLLKTQAQLTMTAGKLDSALTQVNQIRPAPDKEGPALRPDGQVILVDEANRVVRLSIGSDDCVYQGLTFSVYDPSAGIPRDGKGKAQVEVFAIDARSAAARVLSSDPKNPITTGDIVANLIWDCGKKHQFVVAGEFDLNEDGKPDYDAARKIEGLIQRWGGEVVQAVTSETDFVILGIEPQVPTEPTLEAQAADPTAMERYNAARQKNEYFNQVRTGAQALNVPIYNYDRFLCFTGCVGQTNRPGVL